MKKLIIILIAAISFNAVSAQSRDSYTKEDHGQATQTRDDNRYNNRQPSKAYAYNSNYGRDNDRNRREEYDRVNRQFDKKIEAYRNDRSLNPYERDRRINEAGQQRQQALCSFGNGAIAGGVAGLLSGILTGHR
jgi:Ni/Co efflux regulator RcnB